MDQLIFDRVQELTAEMLGVKKSLVRPESKFVMDLAADSIDLMQLADACEMQFDIRISTDDAQEFNTVGDLVAYIESKGVDVTRLNAKHAEPKKKNKRKKAKSVAEPKKRTTRHLKKKSSQSKKETQQEVDDNVVEQHNVGE